MIASSSALYVGNHRVVAYDWASCKPRLRRALGGRRYVDRGSRRTHARPVLGSPRAEGFDAFYPDHRVPAIRPGQTLPGDQEHPSHYLGRLAETHGGNRTVSDSLTAVPVTRSSRGSDGTWVGVCHRGGDEDAVRAGASSSGARANRSVRQRERLIIIGDERLSRGSGHGRRSPGGGKQNRRVARSCRSQLDRPCRCDRGRERMRWWSPQLFEGMALASRMQGPIRRSGR